MLVASPPSDAPIRLSDPVTLQRMSAALPLVLRMLEDLGLGREDQATLTGIRVRNLQRSLKDGVRPLCQDQVTRLSLLSGIYQALLRTFPEDTARRWFTRPQQGAPFNGQTPLAYMRDTGIIGLYATRSLLDAASHGNFSTSAEDRRAAAQLPQPAFSLTAPGRSEP